MDCFSLEKNMFTLMWCCLSTTSRECAVPICPQDASTTDRHTDLLRLVIVTWLVVPAKP